MPTHPVRGRTPKGKQRKGKRAGTKKKTRGEQYNCDKTTPNPMRNHHRRSRAANLSQPAGEPQKGHQLHDTECKTSGVPRQAEQTHQGGSARAVDTPSRRGRRYSTAVTEIKFSQGKKKQGPTREGGLQPRPPRLVTRGERERRE